MTLGMISWIREEDFQRVKAKGLSFIHKSFFLFLGR